MERQIAAERNHERQLIEAAKRERQMAEERAMNETLRVRQMEKELTDFKKQNIELRARKDELGLKLNDYDKIRLELDRMRIFESDNNMLRENRRDNEIKI